MYGYMPREKFLAMWLGKLKEVIDKYHPDLMWFDSWLEEIPENVRQEYLAYYYNHAAQRGKEVVVTRKQDDLPLTCSVQDIEKGRSDKLTENFCLTDDTISMGSWCYTQDLRIKPTPVVLHSLIDIVSKNGALLLNISPMADGTIPENQRQVLLEIGKWLKINGEAIYGTRPWKVFGEGATQGRAGQFGGVTDPKGGYQPQDIRFTTKGGTLYAISLGWAEKPLTIRSLGSGSDLFPGEIASVKSARQQGQAPVVPHGRRPGHHHAQGEALRPRRRHSRSRRRSDRGKTENKGASSNDDALFCVATCHGDHGS